MGLVGPRSLRMSLQLDKECQMPLLFLGGREKGEDGAAGARAGWIVGLKKGDYSLTLRVNVQRSFGEWVGSLVCLPTEK